MITPNAPSFIDSVTIRPYEHTDQDAVCHLYEEGRLAAPGDQPDDRDDINRIQTCYMEQARTNFWVADYEGKVIGMIGVIEIQPHLAKVRRLRVTPEFQRRGVGIKLMETALEFCRRQDYLKVVLDTGIRQDTALEVFDRFAFQHDRTRRIDGKDVLEFYLDLYHEPEG